MTRGIPKLHRHEILNGSLLVARLACAVCLLFVADQANGESMKATGMEPQNGFAYHDISIGGPDMVDGLNNKIRVLQRRAYGYADEEYLNLKIVASFLPKLTRSAENNLL